jgi:hypothetical protein
MRCSMLGKADERVRARAVEACGGLMSLGEQLVALRV